MDVAIFKQDLADKFNIHLSISELEDVDFVTKLIAKYGYSISYSTITEQVYREKRGENNLPPDEDMLSQLRDNVCFYTYQLYGRQYLTRGSHSSPLIETLQQCVLVALYNVLNQLPDESDN